MPYMCLQFSLRFSDDLFFRKFFKLVLQRLFSF